MVTNKKALIIDDSRTACLVLSRQLLKLGIPSDSVYSAQAALDYLVDERPAVIFLDHSMPGMDGFEAIKVMKSNPDTATIPVMMYTSNSGDVYLSQARALGALDVIQKNMEPGIIAKTLSKLGLIPKHTAKAESIEAEIAALEEEKKIQPSTDMQFNLLQQNISNLEHNIQQKLHLLFGQHLSTLQKSLEENIDYKSKKLIHKSSKQVIEENKHLSEESTKNIQKEIEHISENIQNQSNVQRNKIKWLGYTVSLQLLLILALVTFQWNNTNQTSSNSTAITDIQRSAKKQYTLLQQLIENQQHLNYQARGIPAPLSGDRPTDTIEAKYLSSKRGELIGKILASSSNGDSLNIVNEKGYLFQLDADLNVISQVPKRYFLEQACYGTAFVKSHKGLIFTDAEQSLWFTDINAREEVITPSSLMHNNSCQAYYGEPLEVIALLPNEGTITGVKPFNEPPR